MEKLLNWLGRSPGGLGVIWAVYILPRLAMCCLDITPTSDADWYYHRAIGLAAGQGYLSIHGQPTAYWPPGWPMALSVGFGLFGPGLLAVKVINLLASILIGWLTLDLGARLFDRRSVGRLGLLLLAVYPNAIGYVPLALTEVFYTALLLLGCWLLLPRGNWLWLVAAGAVFGFATLVKAQTLVCVPLVLGIGLLRHRDDWRAVARQAPATMARGVLVLACAAAVVAPWTMRNMRVLGHPVMVSTNGGITLLTGNCNACMGSFTEHDAAVDALKARGLDEVAYDGEAKRLGVAWIMAHPVRFIALMPVKLLKTWGPDGEAVWAYETGYARYASYALVFRAVRVVNQLWYWALLAGSIVAFVLARRRGRALRANWVDWWLLPYAIMACNSAIVMVFSGQTRFHYPVMPLLCLVCGWLIDDWSRRRASRVAQESGEPSRHPLPALPLPPGRRHRGWPAPG